MDRVDKHRNSGQRRAILAVIRSRGGHSTADQIYEAVRAKHPRISLGTVYRNLRVLCDQGEIREVNSDASFARFEIAGPQHYHLVCRKCGHIEDCVLPVDKSLEERVKSITSFKIEQHELDFIGLCSKCQSLVETGESTANQI
jgi:Fe2+ or Zn2+ uptake regulation protein